ncbi:myosin-binding protein C, fast-type-like [Ptychodera flava]|uniref:myosin-binding protein C, fast-type-like n=1 Tax=Ptychodera flava TaxID=63121 RepID=UPI003969CE2A
MPAKPREEGRPTVTLTTTIPVDDVKDTTWFKDGVELDTSDSDKYSVKVKDGKAALIIKDADLDDEAVYTCQADTFEASTEFKLPEADKEKMPAKPREEGRPTVTLTTTIPVDDVKDTTWFKDGVELDTTDSDKYSVKVKDGKAALIIKDADLDDEAVYTCQADTFEASTEFKLPEDDKEKMPDKPRKEGRPTVTLTTTIPVDDVKDTTWFKDGVELDTSDSDKYSVKVKDGKAALIIKDADLDDEAVYTCQADTFEASTEFKLPEGITDGYK